MRVAGRAFRDAVASAGLVAVLAVAQRSAGARGEASVALPEVRVPVSVARDVVRTPAWSRAALQPPAPRAVLARGEGIVAFSSEGRMCGFAESDGRRVWCAERGSAPAYAGGIFAYVGIDGMIDAVHASSGRPAWRFTFPASAVAERSFLAQRYVPPLPREQIVWAAGNGFLARRSDARSGNGDVPSFGELSPAGTLRWSADLHVGLDEPIVVPPFAIVGTTGSGARMQATQHVLRLGPGGGEIAAIVDAWTVVEVRSPALVVDGDRVEEVEDHFLTRDLWLATIRTGTVGGQYHYEPDYDVIHDLYMRNAFAIDNDAKGSGTEGDAAYLGVGPYVYRYRLAEPDGQRPLLVSREGRFAGGPVRGAIFVARRDGVWLLRVRAHAIEARLFAPSAQRLTALSVAGRVAYAATADGRVRGIDLTGDRIVLDAAPCEPHPGTIDGPVRRDRIRAGPHRVYVVCGEGAGVRVVAFARPDAS